MTIIARMMRRTAMKKAKVVKRARQPLKPTGSRAITQQSPGRLLDVPTKGLSNDDRSPNPIEVDGVTMQAMEIEVQDMLCSTKSVTVSAIANALINSRRVTNLYASQGSRRLMDKLWKQLKSLAIAGKSLKHEKDALSRRYALVNALNYLQKIPASHTQHVASWEEALPFLKKIFDFPEDTENLVKDSKPDSDVVGLETYKAALESSLAAESASFDLKPLHEKWKQVAAVTPPGKLYRGRREGEEGGDDEKDALALQMRDAEADLASRKAPGVKDMEERFRVQEQEEEAKKRASSLMRPLTDEEQDIVQEAMYGLGPGNEVIARDGTDSVQRASMQTLQPGQWVGDEVISYFLLMLSKRDEELCQKNPARKRSHFFKSFFFTKLLNEGHANPDMDGTYEYRNVKRWSKKVPGKDIFKLDKVVFPINVQRMHWICAVAFITEKRIQIYDSMGSGGSFYLDSIFRYLQDEHKDKKKAPLPDLEDWKLVSTTSETPRQRNGYDCGVFTCMAADFLSKDCPLVYSQDHITQCRERIALSIMNGKAIM